LLLDGSATQNRSLQRCGMPMCLNIRLLLAHSQNNSHDSFALSKCNGRPQESAIWVNGLLTLVPPRSSGPYATGLYLAKSSHRICQTSSVTALDSLKVRLRRGRLLCPSPAATADLSGGFRFPSKRACVLPATPARTCVRTYSNKEVNRISFFVKWPRFKQRSGRGGKNPSRVSAFAPMNAHRTRALDRTFPPPPVAKSYEAGALNEKN
jgi:hypothetical protein